MSDLREAFIKLRPDETQSGLDRVKWAEGLIRQLPDNHDGRNSWLLNYAGEKHEADKVAALSAQPQPEAVEPVGNLAEREVCAQHTLARIRKVRDGYADQARFADVEPASYFREFVRRLDRAVDQKPGLAPWNGAPPLASDERMRRALETTIRELERARDYNNAPNSVTITRLKEALSGAADASNASAEARLLTGSLAKDVAAAAKRVAGWSAAKQDYARRAMGGPLDPTPAEQREAIARGVRDQLLQLDLGCGEDVNIHDAIAHLRGDADVGHAVELIEDVAAWIADAILALSTRAGG